MVSKGRKLIPIRVIRWRLWERIGLDWNVGVQSAGLNPGDSTGDHGGPDKHVPSCHMVLHDY